MGMDFLQITDRHINGSPQVDFWLGLSRGSSITQRDDFSTQVAPPNQSQHGRGMLINP
jgi:hypothetical protein